MALSPTGARVAIDASRDHAGLLVLDTATGQLVRDYESDYPPERLYWLGVVERGGRRSDLLVSSHYACSTQVCGNEFGLVSPEEGSALDTNGEVTAALPQGVVIQYEDPTVLLVFGDYYGNSVDILLPRMPEKAPFGVVADVAHNRLFAVSSAGLVAQIDEIGDGPRVRYHRVGLNGRPFQAAWAGTGRIALWGEDGLGTIDTRTWTTHAIAADVRQAVATPFGIAAWTDNPADGVTVYTPDGSERFRVLPGKRVKTATAVGDYLYADTAGHTRYSINLRTGKVTRTLRPDARILVPDIVAIL